MEVSQEGGQKVTQQDIFFLYFGAMVTIDTLFITKFSCFYSSIAQSYHIHGYPSKAQSKKHFAVYIGAWSSFIYIRLKKQHEQCHWHWNRHQASMLSSFIGVIV